MIQNLDIFKIKFESNFSGTWIYILQLGNCNLKNHWTIHMHENIWRYIYLPYIQQTYITNIYDIFDSIFSVRELWSRHMLLERDKNIA